MDSIPEYVLQRFGLHPEKIYKLNNGSSNENWYCEDVEKRFVVKRIPQKNMSIDMEYRKWLSLILKKNQFPIIEDYYTVERNIAVTYQESWWFVRSFVDGTFPKLGDEEDSTICFEALPKLHSIIKPSNMQIKDFLYWNKDIDYKFKNNIRIMEMILPHNEIMEMMDYYRSVLFIVKENKNCLKCYKSAIVHGDYHSGNIIMQNRKIKAVIDWDTSRLAPRLEDIAKAVYMLSRIRHGYFELNERLAYKLLSDYNTLSPLSIEELEIIPVYLSTFFIPKPEYLITFETPEKLEWYLRWTYKASKNSSSLHKIIKEYIFEV